MDLKKEQCQVSMQIDRDRVSGRSGICYKIALGLTRGMAYGSF
jgi:hypothetical protein